MSAWREDEEDAGSGQAGQPGERQPEPGARRQENQRGAHGEPDRAERAQGRDADEAAAAVPTTLAAARSLALRFAKLLGRVIGAAADDVQRVASRERDDAGRSPSC
jgi:hypothetical protein